MQNEISKNFDELVENHTIPNVESKIQEYMSVRISKFRSFTENSDTLFDTAKPFINPDIDKFLLDQFFIRENHFTMFGKYLAYCDSSETDNKEGSAVYLLFYSKKYKCYFKYLLVRDKHNHIGEDAIAENFDHFFKVASFKGDISFKDYIYDIAQCLLKINFYEYINNNR